MEHKNITILNPRWGDTNKETILCEIIHPVYDSVLPCTLSGRSKNGLIPELYHRVKNGEFGDIGDYVPLKADDNSML